MPLVDAILSMHPIGALAFASVFLGIIIAIIFTVFVSIVTPFFAKKLDSVIFTPRWFTTFELDFYTVWPFSIMKTLYYMYFISIPKFSRRKRFKDIPKELGIPISFHIYSRIGLLLFLFLLITSFTFVATGFYTYFFYEAPPS